MNFRMNNKKYEKSILAIDYSKSSALSNHKYLQKYIALKIPILFNLYENRLIHNEFLKEIFLELLETKEILNYNFQNKIFSLYTATRNASIFKISFFYQTKILTLFVLIIFILRSFRYQKLIHQNKTFLNFYISAILKGFKAPFSLTIIVLNKFIKQIKLNIFIINKKFTYISIALSKKLILPYFRSLDINKNLISNSQNYSTLFANHKFLGFVKLYKSFLLIWICILFKEYILLSKVFKRFDSNLTIKK